MSAPVVLEKWYGIVRTGDMRGLWELLAEEVVFHSPVVHTPQRGRKLVYGYLAAAHKVLVNEGFRYVREVVGVRDAALEFAAEIDGVIVNGVDLIRWDDDDRIVDFTVMVRPLKAINLVHGKMAEALTTMAGPLSSG